jgi:hypothetical protein
MKQTIYGLVIFTACSLAAVTLTRDPHVRYGHTITIKNLSPAKLTITVKNDPDNPTQVVIAGNDTGAVLVSKTKLRVHIEANYNGKILKTNFKRRHDTENYWEISIRKAIIGGIQLIKRDSRPL